ncbi:ABC-2 type transport system ATP-binding protein [Nocardioides perillae]|uniref:ABC-2 type transport system ATP-binding protein n=1 Tax=Nocardioides perillae TaxID=1119534 RepID=A0A7Y9RWT3_9ACTN|nr:ABC-2 type transport system ATP-binding protein [Nocardioides perillae]
MLEARGLTRRFGEVVAVDDVSFEVPAGAVTGFVGGNGAGKTTTMRMLTGVLAVHAGEVRWGDRPATAADRRRFGYMPEERGLYPKQPVLDQLVHLARLRGDDAGRARQEVLALLERFGLADRAREQVQKLSLGNQQRVQVVAALVPRPAVLVLDEPFSGLDPAAVDAMADVLREHARDGVPVLFSSHQLDLVDRLCDRLVVMARGRVAARGTTTELRESGALRYRLTLCDDAGWVREAAGVRVVDLAGPDAVVEVLEPGAEQRLLVDAVARGPVRHFGRVVPQLSEVYREVTA